MVKFHTFAPKLIVMTTEDLMKYCFFYKGEAVMPQDFNQKK